ncbi:enoyl-CoA hydratase-related protein [Streptomyces sulphureus]|uniref:enoyl-CoA hydratase-related protein n=1 Tax=Streptomyces sulphureus TaxID=47758 RepID=UPI00035D3BC3|nr:enoyl-CoA hydratase-related protein [Streptomyces sulphureus]
MQSTTDAAHEAVRSEEQDGVLVVTLDRPKANAIDTSTSRALHAQFTRLQEDPGLRAAVITGAGDRFFSAGWDLKAAAEGEAIDADHGPGGFAGLTELHRLDKPVIAAVGGLAFGGGFELALAADLIVAAPHAEFALPEVRIGMIADSGGVLRLPRRLPRAVATELLLTGKRLSATEAARWGLVNEVAEPGAVLERAVALAGELAQGAPLALAAVKEVLRETEALDVEAGFTRMRSGELPRYDAMLRSTDAEEGPRAFAEKRTPVWKGA